MTTRDNRYRAWIAELGIMITTDVTVFGDGSWCASHRGVDGYGMKEGDALMQFTGEKGNNGNEIWEDDILQFTYGEQGKEKDARTIITGKVGFRGGAFECDNTMRSFSLSEINGIFQVRWSLRKPMTDQTWFYSLEEIERIGNIHENPELLSS